LLPPDSLPSGNQYLQFQNLFTSDSDKRVAWTGVRSMALTRNARLRVRSRGIRFSELVGRPQISEPLVLLAVGEQMIPEQKTEATKRIQQPGELTRIQYEFIDSGTLATRWCLPESWIREQVRARSSYPFPHVRLGEYVRFRWGSPELEAWMERRIISGGNRKAGRILGKDLQ